jgi:hypothetical protein
MYVNIARQTRLQMLTPGDHVIAYSLCLLNHNLPSEPLYVPFKIKNAFYIHHCSLQFPIYRPTSCLRHIVCLRTIFVFLLNSMALKLSRVDRQECVSLFYSIFCWPKKKTISLDQLIGCYNDLIHLIAPPFIVVAINTCTDYKTQPEWKN